MDKIRTSCRNGRRATDGMKVRKMKRGEEEQGTYFPVYPNLPEG